MVRVLTKFEKPENGAEITAINIRAVGSLNSIQGIHECLKLCPNLEQIWISLNQHQISGEGADIVLEDVISVIAEYGRKVKKLRLGGSSIVDSHLAYITESSFPELREVGLVKCGNITAEGIKSFISRCTKLQHLQLIEVLHKEPQMADMAAKYIGSYLPNLRQLMMYRSLHLSDVGVCNIATGCNDLEQISLARNYKLTDESLSKVSEHCKELIAVDLSTGQKK